MYVADYSAARPGGASLAANGCVGVVRYVGALTQSFNLTKAEVADLAAHGIHVATVCEQQTTAILGGAARGAAMATEAVAGARAAGLPDGLVYLAADLNATEGGPTFPGSPGDRQMQQVLDTLTGAATVLGWARVGFYGSFYAIDWLLAHGAPVAAYWQTEAWSDGKRHPKAVLYQRAAPPRGTPAQVDYNDVLGDWHPRLASAPAPVPVVKALTARDLQALLHSIGWPVAIDGVAGPQTTAAVRHFQLAWNPSNGARLAIDGVAGPLTVAALQLCAFLGGLVSQHFRAREFACPHCGDIVVQRDLLAAMEVYRAQLSPGGLAVVSGYRCPTHNADIGGATDSQHLWGAAADVVPIASVARIRQLQRFSGIEYRTGGLVYHVDTRASSGHNSTGSTIANPSIFPWG